MKIDHISRAEIRELQQLSPFELKNRLIALATERAVRTGTEMLNSGRGNPNFTAPTAREAFFRLGFFAVEECRRDHEWDHELVGIPSRDGIADRFRTWLSAQGDAPGVDLLARTLDFGVDEMGFDADDFVWELADSVIGDHYPMPDRMLQHNEAIVRRYLISELCGDRVIDDNFDLFAVEGGTAAMTYLFTTLKENELMVAGDKVAILTPIFTPYLEIPELAEFGLEQVHLHATTTNEAGDHLWQYPDEEIDKLRDPSIKMLFCVNPTNPPSVRIADDTLDRIAEIVATDNPDLMVITDDVYATFIDGFTSLMAKLPHNTATVYSYSKYFGATGWRLGVIAVHQENVFDRRLQAASSDTLARSDERYQTLTLTPRELRFIDRLVADSRHVALNHTAGLSLPQQCQMLLFSAYCLLDHENRYKQLAQNLIRRRLGALTEGTGFPLHEDPNRVGYYVELDLIHFAEQQLGDDFRDFLSERYEPIDILFRLAEQAGVVLLNGGGFDGPEWSIRASLANLDDDDYVEIGRAMVRIAKEYVEEWAEARTGS